MEPAKGYVVMTLPIKGVPSVRCMLVSNTNMTHTHMIYIQSLSFA